MRAYFVKSNKVLNFGHSLLPLHTLIETATTYNMRNQLFASTPPDLQKRLFAL